MRLQNSRTSTLRALLARFVNKSTSCASRSANLDLILLPLRRPVGIKATALAHREEKVVVFAIQSNEGSFLCMFAFRLECDRGVFGTADGPDRWVLHVDGE